MVRRLSDTAFEGGGGYTPAAVGDMTLDQVYMRLTDTRYLRSHHDSRTTVMEPAEVTHGGKVRGRAADGTPIEGRIGPVSVAARVAAEQATAIAAQAAKPQRGRRRRRRGATDGT